MNALGFIAAEMLEMGLYYEFMRCTSSPPDVYWIGEYQEVPTDNESGYEETSFILTGTTRKDWLLLEDQKELIKQHFPSIGGLLFATDNGRGAIFYDNSLPVDTGEAELKRIQINLTIKEWKVK